MKRIFSLSLLIGIALCLYSQMAEAATLPSINIGTEETNDPKKMALMVEILLVFTVLSMAPAILLMMTSFTRLVVAFSFLRTAMGTQQMPPSQVILSLALFLSLFIMAPVMTQINTEAIQPYMAEEIGLEEAYTKGVQPLRQFMFKQTREKDLTLFVSIAKMEKPQTRADIPLSILVPAFMISELQTAFQIGFILFLPFLVIDMVVASVLLSMGMMMLPPVMVSLPFKLLLFVLVDGWYLIVGSLVQSFVM
jgi:flagellar biosynthetic protein FliP